MKRKAYQAEGMSVAGPYSLAVEAGSWVYLSGQLPMDFTAGKLVEGSVAEQAEKCFDNLRRVLAAADLNWSNVVKVTVFLTDMKDFAEMNAVYKQIFEAPFPARSTVAVAALPMGAQIEIELVARRD